MRLLFVACLLACNHPQSPVTPAALSPPAEALRLARDAGNSALLDAPGLPGGRIRVAVFVLGDEPKDLVLYLPGFDFRAVSFGTELEPALKRAVDSGRLPSMALVVPDPSTPLGGDFYAGPWVPALLDRLLPAAKEALVPAEARIELVGHSMGGYGALVLAGNRPSLFHGVAALEPILRPRRVVERLAVHASRRQNPAAVAGDPSSGSFSERLIVAIAGALGAEKSFEENSWRLSADGLASLERADLVKAAGLGARVRLVLVAGSHDPLLPGEDVTAFQQAEPCATLRLTQGDHTSRLPEDLVEALGAITTPGRPNCP